MANDQDYWNSMAQYGVGTGAGSNRPTPSQVNPNWVTNGGIPNPFASNNVSGQSGQGFMYTGQQAGSSDGDPMSNFWGGAALPSSMQTSLGATPQAGYVNGLNGQVSVAQSNLLNQLQNQAAGRGPSLATQQLQQGLDQNVRGQAALAAGGRNPAMAMYQAGQNAAAAGQTMAGQAAMARTQEQLNAQNALAGLSNSMQGNALANAGLAQQVNLANMGMAGQYGLQQGQMNQQAILAFNQMMAQQQQAYNQYLYNKDIQRTQDNDSLRNGLVSGGISGGAQMGSSALAAPAAGGGGAGLAAAAASDERLKTNVRDGSALLRELLSKAGTHAYVYKHPGAPGQDSREHVSPMAQELEKSKLGAQMVRDTPHGKMVDGGPHTVNTLLAALADMHKRVEVLEKNKRKAA